MLSSLPKNSKVSIAWLSESVIEGALMSCPPWGRKGGGRGEGKERREGEGRREEGRGEEESKGRGREGKGREGKKRGGERLKDRVQTGSYHCTCKILHCLP